LGVQATGIVSVAVWSALATYILMKVTQAVVGMRATDEQLVDGMDISEHGERGYEI
ncbi:MAG: ammonium transporter, partial [Alphaproteobacteria bacterium]|nr:ammonium transporter [Alphaproteobacteria bacterium]